MTYVFATYIVNNGLITQARAKCKAAKDDPAINLPGLDGMFTTPLIRSSDPDGANPTHWISSGWISEAERDYLNAQLPGPFEASDGTFIDQEGNVVWEGLHGMLARLGHKIKGGVV